MTLSEAISASIARKRRATRTHLLIDASLCLIAFSIGLSVDIYFGDKHLNVVDIHLSKLSTAAMQKASILN